MRYLAMTEARRKLPELVKSEMMSVITKQGRPTSVLMSFDAFRAIMADLETLSDPRFAEILADHKRALQGDTEGFEAFTPETITAARAEAVGVGSRAG